MNGEGSNPTFFLFVIFFFSFLFCFSLFPWTVYSNVLFFLIPFRTTNEGLNLKKIMFTGGNTNFAVFAGDRDGTV